MSNFYYRIPAELLESGQPTKACLFGCIESLCREKGYCWAPNDFLASKLGLKSISVVSQYINELKREGWIMVEINQRKRKIWLLRDYCGKTIDVVRKNGGNPSEKTEEGIIMSIKNSNHSNHNISLPTLPQQDKSNAAATSMAEIDKRQKIGYKPFYGGWPVRIKDGKIYVIIDGGQWNEFNDTIDKIEWKK